MPIIHYVERAQRYLLCGDVRTLCQMPGAQHVTQDETKVTCKRCLKVLESVGEKATED